MTEAQAAALKIAEENLACALTTYGERSVVWASMVEEEDSMVECNAAFAAMCFWQNKVWQAAQDVAYFKAN